jgi:hypothetical protein
MANAELWAATAGVSAGGTLTILGGHLTHVREHRRWLREQQLEASVGLVTCCRRIAQGNLELWSQALEYADRLVLLSPTEFKTVIDGLLLTARALGDARNKGLPVADRRTDYDSALKIFQLGIRAVLRRRFAAERVRRTSQLRALPAAFRASQVSADIDDPSPTAGDLGSH